MFKRILVPIDDSKPALAGLRTAVALARDQKARLRLLHVADMVPAVRAGANGTTVSDLFELMRAGGEALLARNARYCAARGLKAETRLYVSLAGGAAQAILGEAKKWRADVIVMGTHGRRGLSRVAMGSDAEAVVRAAPVPVLLTRAASK